MSLKFAILGFLTFEPMSGYTLKTRYFDRSVAHFWPADQAQIYRTLQSLEQSGEIVSEVVESDTRPSRKIYTIAEKGKNALTQWLEHDQGIFPQRDGFLVQLYFGKLLSREQILKVLNRRLEGHIQQRQYFDDLELPNPENETMRRQILFGGMTLDFARRREVMMIEWLEECIKKILELPDSI